MNDHTEICARLVSFLKTRIPEAKAISVSEFQPITGGYSRVMARFTATIDGQNRQLIFRADPPAEKAIVNTHGIDEWPIVEALTRLGNVPMPDALYFDADGSELGATTIIYEALDGGSFLSEIKSASESGLDELTVPLVNVIAQIHAIKAADLPETLIRPDSWDEYLNHKLAALRLAEEKFSDSNPFMRYLATWLDINRPPPAPLCLIHGEFNLSNVMREHASTDLKVVDWELARIGDPREDLGYCQWVSAMQPPNLIGRNVERVCALYREASGLSSDMVNPKTIAYFSILAGLKPVQELASRIDDLARERNSSLVAAYLMGALSAAHEGWRGAVRTLS